MRISFKHKFIFLANMRAGSRTIRDWLTPYSEIHSTTTFRAPFNPNIKSCFGHHVDARTLKNYFDTKQNISWDDFYVFTHVRDPFKRVFTLFWNGINKAHNSPNAPWIHAAERSGNSLAKFLQQEEIKIAKNIDEFCYDEEGNCLVNQIIKIEDFNLIKDTLANTLGIETLPDAPKKDKVIGKTADMPDYREYYDSEAIELVKTRYAKDIEIGNYTID